MKKILEEIVELQNSYQELADEKRLTKKAMCDLCVPFRDKYNLTDLQMLRIARKQMELDEIVAVFEQKEDTK